MAEGTKKKKNSNIYWIIGVLIVAAVILIVALNAKKSSGNAPYQESYQAMGTVISSTIYGDSQKKAGKISDECKDEIDRLEKEDISWRKKGSDVWNINKYGEADVDPATAQAIRQCLDVAAHADGNYDITIGKLSTLWNIGTEDARKPSQAEIDAALPYVDYHKVIVNGNHVKVGKGQFLDLGGIGKGYAADKCAEILKKDNAVGGAVAVGGSICLYGKNPSRTNGHWNIGIQDPNGTHNETCMTFETGPCFVSTSGDYEKVLVVDGKKYHHILDPRTGYPAQTDVTSVTVVCDNGALSDALATCCFMYGYGQKSLDLLKHYNAEAVFIAKDGSIYATSGIKNNLVLTNSNYHFA